MAEELVEGFGWAVTVFLQLALAVAAWGDLLKRSRSEVRGPKWCWALIILVSFIGPMAYFCWARRTPDAAEGRTDRRLNDGRHLPHQAHAA